MSILARWLGRSLALAVAVASPAVLRGQSLGEPTTYIRLDVTRGFGGYELTDRTKVGWALGVDVRVHRLLRRSATRPSPPVDRTSRVVSFT
jgi:hypothetical protein